MDIQVDIVSAEQEIWSGFARMLFAPGEMGELGILPQTLGPADTFKTR